MGRKLWMKSIRARTAAASLLLGLLGATATAATVAPGSMSLSAGDSSGAVSALAASNEGKLLKLYTDRRGNLDARFQFAVTSANAVSVSARLSQASAGDRFRLQVKNASGAFVDLGSTSAVRGFQSVSFALPSGSLSGSSLTIRLLSSAGADDLQLDSLLVSSQAATNPPPPPTPTPVPPAPTPVPPAPTPMPPAPTPMPPTTGKLNLPPGISWYWQLQGTPNMSVAATVYDIDLFDNSAATFASLKAAGHVVICYFSAGTYENWRPDAAKFPAAGLGANMEDWPGERWLDVRNADVRAIMAARLDLAKSKGCDGVEPDNVDGYDNKNGVGLTKQNQIDYNTFLADQAHARGLGIALKNSTDLVSSLVSKFDFAVVEECFAYDECDAYTPFVKQGKAVLNAEYTKASTAVCSEAKQLGLSTAFYNLDLNGKVYSPCK